MSQVSIIDIEGNHPQIPTQFDTDSGAAIPIGNVLEILATYVAAGSIPAQTTGSGNTVTVEIQTTQEIASSDATKIGLAAFDAALFDVDANGFVTLTGGGGTTSIDVDAFTAPGTDPVAPTGGNIVMTGAQVAAGTIGTNVIRTNSLAASTVTIEIQRSSAMAGSASNANGVSHFDSAQFTVDSAGFVSTVPTAIANTITGQSGGALSPTAGNWNIYGATVAAGTTPVSTSGAGSTLTTNVQISQAIASTDATKIGLAAFDSASFSVDANGFVTLVGGGPVIDSFTTDVAGPVAPDGSGVIDVTGTSVFSDGTVANTLTLNVQATANTFLIGAGAGSTATELGPLTDGQLIIGSTGLAPVAGSITSTDGSVTITPGAGTIDLAVAAGNDAILTLTGDAGGAVSPTSGDVDLQGVTVANAANAKPVFFQGTPGSSLIEVDVQVGAAITGAPGDNNDAGLVSFDDTSFAVDANGYVTLSTTGTGKTITGDSGGALSPTSNNWNILGLSGSKTSGTGSTLTVKSPPYADASATATSSLNTGEFVTGAYTRTLPASAGLADGDLIEFVCTSASALVIQAVGAQQIRLGSVISSAAGTATSTAIGDSLSLRFRATDGFWYATSSIGTWVLA